jgi:hypothetical protein
MPRSLPVTHPPARTLGTSRTTTIDTMIDTGLAGHGERYGDTQAGTGTMAGRWDRLRAASTRLHTGGATGQDDEQRAPGP